MRDVGEQVRIKETQRPCFIYACYDDKFIPYYQVVYDEVQLDERWPESTPRILFWDDELVDLKKTRKLRSGREVIEK